MVVRDMPVRPPPDLSAPPAAPEVDAYRFWKPEAQAKALEMLREHSQSAWRPFFCPDYGCDGHPHSEWEWEHARADQRPPRWSDHWLTLLLSGGRGSGKTRVGSEITHRVTKATPRIALIAGTGPDLRDTMVEGVSGILACSPPGKRPDWEPSKKKLTWPNGCIAQGFSAEEPDRLRGPQFGFSWADEPAHYAQAQQVWDNMLFGLRMGTPKVIATTTPKPTTWMKALIADPTTVTRRVSTYANLQNLAPTFLDIILNRYEGTRLGKQELHGELLEDVEGSLWNWDMIHWVDEAPALQRVVVGVDPAGSANKSSDETGIITVGLGVDKNFYVLADDTGRYSPANWAARAIAAYEQYQADAIVAEKNYGGDMVKHTLKSADPQTPRRILPVNSRRGKALRAEPVVALYERRRVLHVGHQGDLAKLEDEQTQWVPGVGDSPNRVDALVHAITALAKNTMPTEIANPNNLLRRGAAGSHLSVVA
jgi:phage terminase large subunit-like protein